MELLKTFLKSKQAIRAYWTMLNVVMGLVVSLVAFLATNSVEWAVMVNPFVVALSQWFTKEIVNKKM